MNQSRGKRQNNIASNAFAKSYIKSRHSVAWPEMVDIASSKLKVGFVVLRFVISMPSKQAWNAIWWNDIDTATYCGLEANISAFYTIAGARFSKLPRIFSNSEAFRRQRTKADFPKSKSHYPGLVELTPCHIPAPLFFRLGHTKRRKQCHKKLSNLGKHMLSAFAKAGDSPRQPEWKPSWQ